VTNAMMTTLQMKTFRVFLYLHMERHVLLVMPVMAKENMADRLIPDGGVVAIQAAIESVVAASNTQALRLQNLPGIINDAGLSF